MGSCWCLGLGRNRADRDRQGAQTREDPRLVFVSPLGASAKKTSRVRSSLRALMYTPTQLDYTDGALEARRGLDAARERGESRATTHVPRGMAQAVVMTNQFTEPVR